LGSFLGAAGEDTTAPRRDIRSQPPDRNPEARLVRGCAVALQPSSNAAPAGAPSSRTKTMNRAPIASAPTTPSNCPIRGPLTSQSGRWTAPHDAVSRHTKCTVLASCDRNQPDGPNLRDRQRPSPKTPYFVGSGPDMQFLATPSIPVHVCYGQSRPVRPLPPSSSYLRDLLSRVQVVAEEVLLAAVEHPHRLTVWMGLAHVPFPGFGSPTFAAERLV